MTQPRAKQYYARVASDYDEVRGDYFYYCERYSVLQLLPDIDNRQVLDVACGTGLYTRLFEKMGANRVAGLDISAEMLSQARRQQTSESVIEYIEGDICQWTADQQYDLVFSTYIFNYAASEEELSAMIRSMAAALKPGGMMLMTFDILGLRQVDQYLGSMSDFQIYHDSPLKPYEQFRLTLKGQSDFDIYPHHIDPADMEQLLEAHGLSEVRFHPAAFHEEIWQKVPAAELRVLICYPGLQIVSAIKVA